MLRQIYWTQIQSLPSVFPRSLFVSLWVFLCCKSWKADGLPPTLPFWTISLLLTSEAIKPSSFAWLSAVALLTLGLLEVLIRSSLIKYVTHIMTSKIKKEKNTNPTKLLHLIKSRLSLPQSKLGTVLSSWAQPQNPWCPNPGGKNMRLCMCREL